MVTTPGVVGFLVAQLLVGGTGGFPRVDVDVGLGSCVTRVVTTAEAVFIVAEEGSWVSRVGVVLFDEEVVGLGIVATPVDTTPAVLIAGGVGLLRA